ncbi:hypothetical protein C8F04DRAFT_1280647 [Mycena alexandri]|uniref:Uncharacterized protein n=1 Tax=Mycena alexandri TaxID=1745969 RepID=A0AAD6WMH9_9AGAR|nr:hypothetical protein C8F04DRAFT_1280647 [Mycena alexandri]
MAKSEAEYDRCTCTVCVYKAGPEGDLQKRQTIRKHLEKDARRQRDLPASADRLRPPANNNQSPQPSTPSALPCDADADSDDEAGGFHADYGFGNSDSETADLHQFDRHLSSSPDSVSFQFSSDDDSDIEFQSQPIHHPDFDDFLTRKKMLSRKTMHQISPRTPYSALDHRYSTHSNLVMVQHPERRRRYHGHSTTTRQFAMLIFEYLLGAAFNGMTRQATTLMLNGYRVAFESAAAMGVDYPGLSNFALTLSTVEKRLGVSTDDLITYFFLCDVCWKPHNPEELATLESPACNQPECGVLTLPFVAPEKAIQRMCLQPGKVAQWQEWRGPLDAPGAREPSSLTGYAAFPDLDKPMNDISDGWGLESDSGWFGASKEWFLGVIQINIDWFQAVKGGCHSTGAMYATICNNPRAIRNLREETILILIFPGPHEPTSDQYNNVMEICLSLESSITGETV